MNSLHALILGLLLLPAASAASGSPSAVSFLTSEATGAITNLAIAGDATGMNWTHVADGSQYAWIAPSCGWGTGTLRVDGRKCAWTKPGRTAGVDISVARRMEGGVLYERYLFSNATDRAVSLSEIDIHAPFNDNYPKMFAELYSRRCHAHVWTGGNAGWVCAMRIGGKGPHLGLAVVEGDLAAYELKERALEKGMSNVRGVIALSPADVRLGPGETTAIAWRIFAHEGREDFFRRLVAVGGADVSADRYAAKPGETVRVTARTADGTWTKDWTCPSSGDHRVEIAYAANGDCRSHVEVLGVEDPKALLLSRARFILRNQQVDEPGSVYDGAFVPFDTETGRQERIWEADGARYTCTRNDHSEGGERIGMGVFLSLMARRGCRDEFLPALIRYARFVRTCLQDADYTSWRNRAARREMRSYNYPWYARFYLEMYDLTGDRKYLEDAWGTVRRLFDGRGVRVPIAVVEFPILRLHRALAAAGMSREAETFLSWVRAYAEPPAALNRGDSSRNEVGMAPERVSSVIRQQLELRLITGEGRYLDVARDWMVLSDAILGLQPSWHAHDIGLHHWDGFWFGKRMRWGDTMPHDWDGGMAIAFARYAEATGDESYRRRAVGIANAMLGLFTPDGRGTCGWVYPDRVNGVAAKGPDPLCNDQDWALVYYLEMNPGLRF